MALINGIGREVSAVAERIFAGVFKAIFVHGFRYYDRFRLRNYTDDIVEVRSLKTTKSGIFAVFVYYEPNGEVSGSVNRFITELCNANVNIIVAVNHSLSDEQAQFFQQKCHSILLRGNQGFDFGCFRDAIGWMRKTSITPDRLLLLNDSVFYVARGLPEFISGLLGKEDVIAAFENWGEGYHLQSFALSVSLSIVSSSAFEAFWKRYVPSNNRVLAIELGEKKLSRTLLKVASSSRVLFPVSRLYEVILESQGEAPVNPITVCQPWRSKVFYALSKVDEDNPKQRMKRAAILCQHINTTSPIHSGAYYFPHYLKSPIYKKDLVYRDRFAFWEVDAWSIDLTSPEERYEFGVSLRAKGDYSQLGLLDKIMFRYGVK
jgi:hypothetical protein